MAPNPLRTEREAFRVFLYVLAVFVVAMLVTLVIQAPVVSAGMRGRLLGAAVGALLLLGAGPASASTIVFQCGGAVCAVDPDVGGSPRQLAAAGPRGGDHPRRRHRVLGRSRRHARAGARGGRGRAAGGVRPARSSTSR